MLLETMAGREPDAFENIGLLHADALQDSLRVEFHAVLRIDPLVGERRQRLAVDQHAVAVEYDQSVRHALSVCGPIITGPAALQAIRRE